MPCTSCIFVMVGRAHLGHCFLYFSTAAGIQLWVLFKLPVGGGGGGQFFFAFFPLTWGGGGRRRPPPEKPPERVHQGGRAAANRSVCVQQAASPRPPLGQTPFCAGPGLWVALLPWRPPGHCHAHSSQRPFLISQWRTTVSLLPGVQQRLDLRVRQQWPLPRTWGGGPCTARFRLDPPWRGCVLYLPPVCPCRSKAQGAGDTC